MFFFDFDNMQIQLGRLNPTDLAKLLTHLLLQRLVVAGHFLLHSVIYLGVAALIA